MRCSGAFSVGMANMTIPVKAELRARWLEHAETARHLLGVQYRSTQAVCRRASKGQLGKGPMSHTQGTSSAPPPQLHTAARRAATRTTCSIYHSCMSLPSPKVHPNITTTDPPYTRRRTAVHIVSITAPHTRHIRLGVMEDAQHVYAPLVTLEEESCIPKIM